MEKIVQRKPKVSNGEVFATNLGWEVKYSNGRTELLVSATGLADFIEAKQKEPALEVTETRSDASEDISDSQTSAKQEDAAEDISVTSKTRGRRQKQ